MKAGIGIDTNAVKWNKTIEGTDIKPYRKNFSVKRELEDDNDQDQLSLEKVRVADVDSELEYRNNNSNGLNIHVIDRGLKK